MSKPRVPDEQRFWKHVEKTDAGCWLWTGSISRNGYGKFALQWRPKKQFQGMAHRVSFVLAGRTIPEGLHLDHLCRNRRCVNPDHLEPVTVRENYRRGIHPNAIAANKNECTKGHKITPENSCTEKREDGSLRVRCLQCRRERDAKRAEKKRAVREIRKAEKK